MAVEGVSAWRKGTYDLGLEDTEMWVGMRCHVTRSADLSVHLIV